MATSLKNLITLLLVATLTACAAPPSPTSLPPTTSAPNTSMLSTATAVPPTAIPMPNPLTVQVVVDESLAVSAVISTTGGTLTAQAADGTKFTLTFPEGALQSDENITLTPVSSVEGLPFSGGLVGGVQMAPEGLRLFQPATLTIESPKTVAAEGFETVAFGYHQDGEGVYLNPSTVTGNILTLELWHFSGKAAAQATPAEIQTQQQQYVPSIAEDAFTQRVQEAIGLERQAQLMGEPDPNFLNRMSEFLREAYDSFIAPQLPIALEDCAKAPAILSRALSWARQAELLGVEDEFRAEIDKIIDTYEQAKEKCIRNYVGEGKYRTTGGQSGIEMISGYEFLITFRANADGTIVGEGVLTKVEESWGSSGFTCNRPGVSSVTFPPMKVSGIVKPDAAGQPDAMFQLTIVGLSGDLPPQVVCETVGGPSSFDAPDSDGGFILENIEIAAMDGAQANGEINDTSFGTTVVTTWELQIHKQENP